MKKILIYVFMVLLIILSGCATSKYRPAEKYLLRREYNKALRHYLHILEPHVRDGKPYIYYDKEAVTGIGMVYWHMGRYETAEKILKMVVNKNPEYGKARYYLGISLEELGRIKEAIDVYKEYFRVPERDPFRQILMGRLDWVVRMEVSREIQLAIKDESRLDVAAFPEKSVAVLYFLNLSDDPKWQPLQKGLAEMMITDLSKVDELDVVERIRLNSLMDEIKLGMTGLIDENNMPRVGKLLGARYLVKGSYLVMPDLRMTLDAGIYETKNVFVPTTTNFEGNLNRLFRMEKELVLRIFDYFDIKLSPQLREEILKIPTEDMMAFMKYCQGLDAMDRGDFSSAYKLFREAVKIDGNFTQARDKLMSPKLWQATHSTSTTRMNREVARIIREMPRGGLARMEMRPDLVSSWNRLQWMGRFQNAGLIPGRGSRKSFNEAERNAILLPKILGTPIKPDLNKK